MSDLDRKLIQQARNIDWSQWFSINDLIEKAESEEAKEYLSDIMKAKYHTEVYKINR